MQDLQILSFKHIDWLSLDQRGLENQVYTTVENSVSIRMKLSNHWPRTFHVLCDLLFNVNKRINHRLHIRERRRLSDVWLVTHLVTSSSDNHLLSVWTQVPVEKRFYSPNHNSSVAPINTIITNWLWKQLFEVSGNLYAVLFCMASMVALKLPTLWITHSPQRCLRDNIGKKRLLQRTFTDSEIHLWCT